MNSPTVSDPLAELCGWGDSPGIGAPPHFHRRLESLADRIRRRSEFTGSAVDIDPIDEVTRRARLNRWTRDGRRSVGGSCAMLDASDGVVAVNLARPDDHTIAAAVLGLPLSHERVRWSDVARAVTTTRATELVAMFADTGVPVSSLGETVLSDADVLDPVRVVAFGGRRVRVTRRPRVVDLSSLWAGPLCSRILARAGFEVVKVESTGRPDGARLGHRQFFHHLNDGKATRAVDFTTAAGRADLRSLVSTADVVIEGSRPRALEQLGIDAREIVGSDDAGPKVWLSITGHGRDDAHRDRVGFGDDCAVAGGLVTVTSSGPVFFGDAVADPLTGLLAAAAVLEHWVAPDQRAVLLDAALARSAAWANLDT